MIPYLFDSNRTLHVSKAGSDSNDGHAKQYPVSLANDSMLTIGAAVTAAADGDTIVIWPGDYAESVLLDDANKGLNLIGTNRMKSRIVPATGAAIDLEDNCSIRNLYAHSTNLQAVVATGKENFTLEDCYFSNAGANTLCLSLSVNVLIRRCFILGKCLPLYTGYSTIVEDCFLISTCRYTLINSGGISGPGFDDVVVILKNSSILVQPGYKEDGIVYTNAKDIKGIYNVSNLIIDNCNIRVDGYKVAAAHANSVLTGNAYGIHQCMKTSIANSNIFVRADQNQVKTAYGIFHAFDAISYLTQLLNTGIKTESTLGSSYDLYATTTARTIYMTGCTYDSAKKNSLVTVKEYAIEGVSGTGEISVDHDYGGTDVLAYKTAGGVGIDNATIKAYLKTDYDAGNVSAEYVKAISTTDVNGRWDNAMLLDAATYTLYYYKQGEYGPNTKEVTVT